MKVGGVEELVRVLVAHTQRYIQSFAQRFYGVEVVVRDRIFEPMEPVLIQGSADIQSFAVSVTSVRVQHQPNGRTHGFPDHGYHTNDIGSV